MPAGPLRKRIRFERGSKTADGGGGSSLQWLQFLEVWGSFAPERGRERVEAGRLEAAVAGIVRIRSSLSARQILTSDRAVFDGVPHQIRSITNPDQRNKYLELVVERGVGT